MNVSLLNRILQKYNDMNRIELAQENAKWETLVLGLRVLYKEN
jgi:hypothetical protein